MERADAFINSMVVLNYMMNFYPKEVVSYTNYSYTIEVTVHLPWKDYNSMREKGKLEPIVVAGAKIEIISSTKHETDYLSVNYGI